MKKQTKGRATAAVSPKNRLVLWTRAGGRCQYTGCNETLLGDLISGKESLNKAFIAHIIAAAPDGPRGHPELSYTLADDLSNLILLCHAHHRLIDIEAEAEHGVARLRAMKQAHEDRIAMVTGIDPSRGTHLLHYAARIGEHDCLVSPEASQSAVLPDRYPLERPISLELVGSDYRDDEQPYWDHQIENLRRQFALRVGERLRSGELRHLSVFAIAPQPLLVELGRLLSDIPDVEVRQLAREPKGWAWRPERPPIDYVVERGGDRPASDVALVLGVSAPIDDSRITKVIGDVPVWKLSAAAPGNDILARPECAARFRSELRAILAAIKDAHGEAARIHLFPALPVALAVEVGRVWMPKADLPIVVYDQHWRSDGFAPRHRLASDGAALKAVA